MSRAMLAEVLWRLKGSPAVSAPLSFSDTSAGAWYADAAAWSAEADVLVGYGNGLFGPDDPVTREQMAAVLWRFEGSPAVQSSQAFIDEADISSWAAGAVDWARTSGIVRGKADGRFDPQGQATRSEAAAMLCSYLTSNSQQDTPDADAGGKILVACFSATGTTRALAEYAADFLNADLSEIVPQDPYTSEDLDYRSASSRATREQNDPAARPAISVSPVQIEDYDIVLLGYPIWHGQAPKIISTFLERYDFSGKIIVPFCTSHSSGIGTSDTSLHSLAPDADWRSGRRFAGGTSREAVQDWIKTLDLPVLSADAPHDVSFHFDTKTVTLNNGFEMPIYGLGTYSLLGDVCVNSVSAALESGVRLIDTAHVYQNEERVGEAVRNSGIPREDIFITTKLYPNQYSNAEAAIDEALAKLDIGYIDLMLLHHPGTGDVEAYRAMEQAVSEGKIRSIGLSNWYIEELEAFLPQVSVTPALVQNEIHPYYQENDVIPYIQSLGIVVQGWYPLGGRGHTAELLGDEVICEIASAHGKSPAQIILRWNLQKGVVVIPGSSNPEHIQENTELFDFALTAEEMARINALDRSEKHDWY